MKKYEVSIIGQFHINHNEDSSIVVEIGKDTLICAVMDGCSMGQESHFASILLTKLIRKIAKEIDYREFIENTDKQVGDYLKDVMRQLFSELRQLSNQLHLSREEILSTIILVALDKLGKEVEIITVGDGLICYDKNCIEYEQDNKPDYLGYHLAEEFDDWYEHHAQKLSLKNVTDLSISTDGIFTFKNFDGKKYNEITEGEIIEYLLVDEKWSNQDNMLNKKLIELEQRYGLKPSDDLTIIRIKIE